MRFLVKASIPVQAGNEAAKKGTMGTMFQSIINELKPEATYFIEENGARTAIFIVNFDNPSDIPAIAEPLFLAFNANVEFHPAMTPEDLAKAAPAIEKAVKNFI